MPSLTQLLAVPGLGLRLIQSGPDDPEITWGSITELLDLSDYLEGGEIIMTTGLALDRNDSRWLDFVASLSRARVAAIGFGVGVNHERVPAPLVQAASTYRVALFEIPLPTPFIAVSKAIAELLRADELRGIRTALAAQERILNAAHGGQDPAEVLASIAQATGRHLAVVGRDGRRIAHTGGFRSPPQTSDEAPLGVETLELDSAGSVRLLIAGEEPLTPAGRAVIAAGAIALSLGLRAEGAAEDRERERWEHLTLGYLGVVDPPSAFEVLEPNAPDALPERIRVVAVQGAAESVSAWRSEPRTGNERLTARNPNAPVNSGLAQAWQLCDASADSIERALQRAAAHGLDAVVGRAVHRSRAALSRTSAAVHLTELSGTAALYAAPRTPRVVWADRDSPMLDALLAMSHQEPGGPGTTSLVTEVLGPLAPDDPRLPEADRETLVQTLVAFFAANGHRGPVSASLGIHRNTLRDRLTRIESLTSRRLDTPGDKAELWLALRLLELDPPRG